MFPCRWIHFNFLLWGRGELDGIGHGLGDRAHEVRDCGVLSCWTSRWSDAMVCKQRVDHGQRPTGPSRSSRVDALRMPPCRWKPSGNFPLIARERDSWPTLLPAPQLFLVARALARNRAPKLRPRIPRVLGPGLRPKKPPLHERSGRSGMGLESPNAWKCFLSGGIPGVVPWLIDLVVLSDTG